MPTYEYRCPEGHQFELFQRMSDEPRATCPTCGAEAERILSGGAGFLFKGEGFYITDYRSESYQKAAKEEQTKAKGGSSGASGDSGTKEKGAVKPKGDASTSSSSSSPSKSGD
jgi:putative FmdB family regulatory protein